MEPRAGEVVAERFRLVRELGRGGMGAVWLAQHVGLNVPCAVKFIHSRSLEKAVARERFEREARASAALRSPYVVQTLDYGTWQGIPYLAMEYVDGETLKVRLKRCGRLRPDETVRIVNHVGRALAKAHRLGIVHRDLKPDNILLVREEDEELAKVLDFGVAKDTGGLSPVEHVTKTGQLLGTPTYMSPEQARGAKDIDGRSDLWALAVITYRCLVGEPPFQGAQVIDLLMDICGGSIPVPSEHAPGIPRELDGWWARASRRDPAERYQSAKELVEALGMALGVTITTVGGSSYDDDLAPTHRARNAAPPPAAPPAAADQLALASSPTVAEAAPPALDAASATTRRTPAKAQATAELPPTRRDLPPSSAATLQMPPERPAARGLAPTDKVPVYPAKAPVLPPTMQVPVHPGQAPAPTSTAKMPAHPDERAAGAVATPIVQHPLGASPISSSTPTAEVPTNRPVATPAASTAEVPTNRIARAAPAPAAQAAAGPAASSPGPMAGRPVPATVLLEEPSGTQGAVRADGAPPQSRAAPLGEGGAALAEQGAATPAPRAAPPAARAGGLKWAALGTALLCVIAGGLAAWQLLGNRATSSPPPGAPTASVVTTAPTAASDAATAPTTTAAASPGSTTAMATPTATTTAPSPAVPVSPSPSPTTRPAWPVPVPTTTPPGTKPTPTPTATTTTKGPLVPGF